jgi:hypothetical protein
MFPDGGCCLTSECPPRPGGTAYCAGHVCGWSCDPGRTACDGTCAAPAELSCCGADRSQDLDHDSVPDCQQSLIVSGQFNKNGEPWSVGLDGIVGWSPMDGRGAPRSGSLRITNVMPDGSATLALAAPGICFTATPNTTYTLLLDYFIPAGQAPGAVSWGFHMYSDQNCKMHINDDDKTFTKVGAWTSVKETTATLPTAHSFFIDVGALRDATAGTIVVYVDNIVLRR